MIQFLHPLEEPSIHHILFLIQGACDCSYWVDAIICDYNYVFDPHVRLQRYFADGERGEYIFLVDEAHNLVERAREMYSAKLEKEEFLAEKNIMNHLSQS